jgi:hypothetical protein
MTITTVPVRSQLFKHFERCALHLCHAIAASRRVKATKWLARLMDLRYDPGRRALCFVLGGWTLRPVCDLQDMMGDPGKIIPA